MDRETLEIITAANQVFGENGWSFCISNIVLDYVDENRTANYYSAGTSAVIRVQRSDGVFREDVGYGSSSGSLKADVISKAKKDAVTKGLRGALSYFGGRIAEKLSCLVSSKVAKGNTETSFSVQATSSPIAPCIAKSSPAPIKSTSDGRNIAAVQTSSTATVPTHTKNPAVSPVSPEMVSKLPSVPQTSPVTTNVPRSAISLTNVAPSSSAVQPSEEELAKLERKRRQRLRQEEFRQKHLLEQAQNAKNKAVLKQTSKTELEASRIPLKQHQTNLNSAKTGNNGTNNTLEVDDDVLLSTQDMEAVLKKADNNSNTVQHAPLLSSPSFGRSVTAPKRPDSSSLTSAAEKKPRVK